jgi:hypothetical protein
MSTVTRLESLRHRHLELEKKIEDILAHHPSQYDQATALKFAKLKIREEIARLSLA